MTYYIVWSSVAILATIGCSSKKCRKFSSIMISFIIVLFAGLRFQRWTDWDMYYDLFNNYGRVNKDFEIVYKKLNWIAKHILRNYNIYLCILYAAVIKLYYSEFKLMGERLYPFCLLVLLSTTILSSGGLRQFIACAITFFSIRFIREKKAKKFFVCVLIAASFHRIALFFLLAYWIDKINITIKKFIEIVIIGVMLGKLGAFQRLIMLFMPLINHFNSVEYRVKKYMSILEDFSILDFGFIKRTLVMILILLILQNNKEKLREGNGIKIYINLYAVGYMLSLIIPGTFSRLNNYFYTSEAVLEAMLIVSIRESRYRIIAFIGMVIMNLAIWINRLLTFYPDLFIPYKSCLF